jgi:beta-aspartyl-dipeptidase (metallo-type)
VALSDHRGGHPTLEQFIHMACQVRLGALTAGKPGVVHIHMGSGKRGLGLVYDLLEATDLPIWHFRPTHMSRWQSEAAAFARKGGMVDFTANADPEKCALPVLRTMEEAPLERITISSDAGGSMPRWSEDHCTMLGMGVGKMDNLLPTIRCLVREHRVPPERAIRLLTQNVADGLCLSRKGRLTVGADADVLLVDRDWNIHTVLAGGEIMVSDGQVVKQPYIS